MLGFLVALVLVGLLVGVLARLLVPGRDDLGLVGTFLLGLTGAFVGGFLLDAITRDPARERELGGPGIIGSTIGAIIVLLIYRALTSRRSTR